MIGEPCCDTPNLVGDGRVKRCTSCDAFYVGDVRAAEPVERLERSRAKSRKSTPKRAPKPKPKPKAQPSTLVATPLVGVVAERVDQAQAERARAREIAEQNEAAELERVADERAGTVPTITQWERDARVALIEQRKNAPHCARCGLRDVHWPGCPNIGTDERPTLQGSAT